MSSLYCALAGGLMPNHTVQRTVDLQCSLFSSSAHCTGVCYRWAFDVASSSRLRKVSSFHWFHKTLMVFDRTRTSLGSGKSGAVENAFPVS